MTMQQLELLIISVSLGGWIVLIAGAMIGGLERNKGSKSYEERHGLRSTVGVRARGTKES